MPCVHQVAARRNFDSVSVLMWCSFLELAGSRGTESQEGSLYMTEEQCFKILLATERIQQMESGKSEIEVYDEIISERAKAESC